MKILLGGLVLLTTVVAQPPGAVLPSPVSTIAARDTLSVPEPSPAPTGRIRQRWLGLGIMVVSGPLAYHYYSRAEATYRAYLRSPDRTAMERLFTTTERLDRRTGWSYTAFQAGYFLFVLSFDHR